MIQTIIILVILIIFSSFFSAAETAYTSVNRIRLKSLAEGEGKKARKARSVLKALERYDKVLTTILVGNNIVNIATSSLATLLVIELLKDNDMLRDSGAWIATVATTIIVLIFGEITPKSLAKQHAESFCLAICNIMTFLLFVFTPLSALFLLIQKGATKLFSNKNKSVSVTEEELMHIIDEIEDEGVLEEQERNLVRSALEFDETTVEQIITPRVNVVGVEINEDVGEVRELFIREGYSRLPVYEKTIDHIVGILNHKEFFQSLYKNPDLQLRDIVHDAIYVPSLMRISEVFKVMQKEKLHIAVVVDQYGGTQGIVTLEDILEELVGEIWDESDVITNAIIFKDKNTFTCDGGLSRNDFNKYFEKNDMGFEIDSDSNTVGGWVCSLFGKIPEENETVKTDDFFITVVKVENRRIMKLEFEILPDEEADED